MTIYCSSCRRIIKAATILALISAALILLLPEIIRRIAVNQLQHLVTAPVSINDVDLNLFTGRGRIEDLVIGKPDSRPILRLPAVTIGFSRKGLFTGEINLRSVVLQNSKLFVERIGPDTYNILKALRLPEGNGTGGAGFRINRLELQGGEIVFIDRTQEPDYELTLSSLNFAAGPISSLPQESVTPTKFRGGVRIGHGSVSVAGSTNTPRQPLETEVTAEITNVEVET